ncbi:M48 family metallopeptidase [Methylobacillus flagellatus]|uniref:M48 family metallopeptidase n=1 Tax=Methylobacillus flagellatus TaxID=405 RepID=UPI0010F4463F|nr:SprT family zinc-dependent metalloprotease [Methylobacillus flagellatus]
MSPQQLQLPDGSRIPYILQRRARRTVGLRISAEGLVVNAPVRLSIKTLETMLLSKAGWIQSKLQARQDDPAPVMHWQSGASVLLLGETLTLDIHNRPRQRQVQIDAGRLSVGVPDVENTSAVARKVLLWYKQQAGQDFQRRLELYAARLGVPTPPLYLSNARSRWGSCNSRGEVRLNWRLIQAPAHIINYVVCHELAHLKQMNHSPKFWAVVGSLYPDYRSAEHALKQMSAQLHVMSLG